MTKLDPMLANSRHEEDSLGDVVGDPVEALGQALARHGRTAED